MIGDTPRDIDAARVNGLSTIAVATGRYSFDELMEHRPGGLRDDAGGAAGGVGGGGEDGASEGGHRCFVRLWFKDIPQGLKPTSLGTLMARLKPCPFTSPILVEGNTLILVEGNTLILVEGNT